MSEQPFGRKDRFNDTKILYVEKHPDWGENMKVPSSAPGKFARHSCQPTLPLIKNHISLGLSAMKEKQCATIGNCLKASIPIDIYTRAKTFLVKQVRVAQSRRSAKDNDEESDDDDYDEKNGAPNRLSSSLATASLAKGVL